jgi:hypothetical protein
MDQKDHHVRSVRVWESTFPKNILERGEDQQIDAYSIFHTHSWLSDELFLSTILHCGHSPQVVQVAFLSLAHGILWIMI